MTDIRDAIMQEAEVLPTEALVELLAHAIRLLAADGRATPEDMRTLRTIEDHLGGPAKMIGSQRKQMDTAIQMFKFENAGEIRVIQDASGDPWFVSKDLCSVLEIGTEQVRRLDDDEKGLRETQTPGGAQQLSVVNESGMYTLIIRSNKPEARRFRKWITSEVLPAIRKNGSYSLKPMTPAEMLVAQAQAMLDYERRLVAVEQYVYEQRAGQQQAEQMLLELPAPTVVVPAKTVRAQLNERVRASAKARALPYAFLWGKLYREWKFELEATFGQLPENLVVEGDEI